MEAASQPGVPSVVVLPTLPLIDQTLAMYRAFSPAIADGSVKVLVVGSDCADESVVHTCEADEIGAFLSHHADSAVLVLSTYDSLPRLAEATSTARVRLGLCVFDEAHMMAGGGRKCSALLLMS